MVVGKNVIKSLALMVVTAGAIVLSLMFIQNVLATFIVYYLICCIAIPLINLKFIRKNSFKEIAKYLGLMPENLKPGLIFGTVAGIILLAAMLGGSWYLQDNFFKGVAVSQQIEAWGISETMLIPMLVTMFIFNGCAEELFWRGYIMKRMEALGKPYLLICAVAFFFTSYHFYPILKLMGNSYVGIFFLFLVFAMGCFWGWTRHHFKSLWPALISHMFVTAGYLTIYLLFIR